MNDKHCDMCCWFDLNTEYCTLYREQHYPTDGAGCIGWEYWDDPFNSIRRMEDDREEKETT